MCILLAPVMDSNGINRMSRVYLGDSIVRKTDAGLNKDNDIVVCLQGERIEHVIACSKPWDIAMEDPFWST